MRYLVVGDLHCQLKHIVDFEELAAKIVRVIYTKQIDSVIFLGDSIHRHGHIHTTELNHVGRLLKECADLVSTTVLIGNHDLVSPSLFLSDEHPFHAMKAFAEIVDCPKKIGDFVFCPYVPNGRFVEALDRVEGWRTASAVFAHQEIQGVSCGNYTSETGDRWFAKYPLLISGHIHQRQKLGDNVLFVGTPYQTTFGEEDLKTVSIFDDEDGMKEVRMDLGCKKRITLQTMVEEVGTVVIPENAHVRLEVHGPISSLVAFKKTKIFKDLIDKGVKIVPRTEEVRLVRSTERRTYMDALRLSVAEEPEPVKTMFQDLFGNRNQV